MLNTVEFLDSLRNVMDKNAEHFKGFSGNYDFIANNFVSCLHDYYKTVQPPSTTVDQALDVVSLSMANSLRAGNSFYNCLADAVVQFATIVSLGMQPAFTGTIAAPNLLNFSTVLMIPLKPEFDSQRITAILNIIHTWTSLCIAVNNNTGSVILWK